MAFEDQFSRQARAYAAHRPHYPAGLYADLAGLTPGHSLAWDCGTGNGQAAIGLSAHYRRVAASDASLDQLAQAGAHPAVCYHLARAEAAALPGRSVDLVTVAQAVQWFDLERFYAEARRVLKPGGVLAAWCYFFFESDPALVELIRRFYYDVIGPYWSPRMQLIADHYANLPFPFEELPAPAHVVETTWALDHLLGFLDTWSGTQNFIQARGYHPVDQIREALVAAWGPAETVRQVRWPVYMRVGRV